MFTRGNAWFLRMEDKIGSHRSRQAGRPAGAEQATTSASTDEEIKTIRPVMTIVDGVVVHDTGELAPQVQAARLPRAGDPRGRWDADY